ncbi:MAG: 50S ribosome-binding GTPase [Arenicellales bacterium]|nr:50S ribosome-binding GTPase [Arenicellales bacterium]
MPTNVSPEYKQAEVEYRQAREPRERLECLQEMLRTIPKHKGTENLQADIKTRIKQLRDELSGPKKGAHRVGPAQVIRAEGAAQVSLIGAPNVGKSSLHNQLTGSGAGIGVYPFTTHLPQPGMLPFEDIQFQLIDLPPVSQDFMESWYINALQPADAAMLVVDPAEPDCVEQVQVIFERLAEKRASLLPTWPGVVVPDDNAGHGTVTESDELIVDPFRNDLPTLMLANKADLGGADEVAVLQELLGTDFPAMAVSAKTGEGLEQLGPFLASALEIVRVYTRIPGKRADLDKPFTVRRGGTVRDVARLVHKDIASSLKFARLWGGGQFAGQQVSAEHLVCDGDIIELHSNS